MEEKGLTAKKSENFSEWYTQVVQKAELAEYTAVSGCMVLRPYAYSMWEKIVGCFDKKIKAIGVLNAYFPLLIPEKLLQKEKEHVEGFSPEVAWVTYTGSSKLDEKLAIRPTSETIMYPSYAKWIRSWRDLPLMINQWSNIVRWEFKNPIPFLRTREFLWQEGHSAFATEEESEKHTRVILDMYADFYENLLAVPVLKGRKTEKEKFAGAVFTESVEIYLPNGKSIQGATSHCLGQNFSKAFNIKFLDKKEKEKYVWQNSWGLTTRTIGIMAMLHGDDKGLVLPPKLAPLEVVIVPIFTNKNKKEVVKKAKEVAGKLECSVFVDDREYYTPGWKFNEYELKGVPIRIEIGEKELKTNSAVLVRRDTLKKETIKLKELDKKIPAILDDIQKSMYNKAKKLLNDNIAKVKDWDKFVKAVADKKIVLAPFCGKIECEDWVKDKTKGVKSINIPFGQKKINENCVQCGKKAKFWVYFGRSY